MTEKRFTVEGWVILNDGESSRIIEVNDLIEPFVEENEQLIKGNLNLLGLLGDIRALARLNDTDTIIEKINKLEKEVLK